MASKSWQPTSTVQCPSSRINQLGRHTDPILDAVGPCKSDGRKKTSKRKSEESPERADKRSRTTPSPSRKRKSEETEGPRERSRRTLSSSKDPSNQATTETSLNDEPAPPQSRAAFEAKYVVEDLLGAGGFGSVFAGYRKDDHLPVAIKRIPQHRFKCISMELEGKICTVPKEVVLLLKFKPAAAGTSAVVSLLDWYELDTELILVLERPVPCSDLIDYIRSRKAPLQEHEAKTITKQLVDALIEVHSKGVFHRDIKLNNILIETGSDVPRVRIIDFGCGTLTSDGCLYTANQGTYVYGSPEWFLRGSYRAEPTTVWQVGVVLFGMLHARLPFSNQFEICVEEPDFCAGLTLDCQDFLCGCLLKIPESRFTLEALQQHPWLMSQEQSVETQGQ